jgi:ABC-type amino acid transport substrate-binding protein
MYFRNEDPMLAAAKKFTLLILLVYAFIGSLTSCSMAPGRSSFDISSVQTYRDIPGITENEIAAIEALRSSRRAFSFGAIPTTEAFALPDGSHAGFTVALCELLSGLFDIPFVLEFHDRDSLRADFDDGNIDFVIALGLISERRQTYFMSHPIAERSLAVFVHENSARINTAADLNGLRLGFLDGTIAVDAVRSAYPRLTFETVFIRDVEEAAEKLEAGSVDAFVQFAVGSYAFADKPSIRFMEILPLAYTLISLSARNPELEPVISVLNRLYRSRRPGFTARII